MTRIWAQLEMTTNPENKQIWDYQSFDYLRLFYFKEHKIGTLSLCTRVE
jgi:hypothetical protein